MTTATSETYTLSLHDALPICRPAAALSLGGDARRAPAPAGALREPVRRRAPGVRESIDRALRPADARLLHPDAAAGHPHPLSPRDIERRVPRGRGSRSQPH